MPNLVIPDASLPKWATILGSGIVSIHAHLWKNAGLTVGPAVVIGDLTEATYSGYLVQTIALNFSGSVDTGAHKWSAVQPSATFPKPTSGTQSVYGVHLTDTTDADLLGLSYLVTGGTAVVMDAAGLDLIWTLTLDLLSEFTS